MKFQELYVVCQIEDFSLKVMVNNYAHGQIQVLYKEMVESDQFAENGIIINPESTGKLLHDIINKINNHLAIKVQRVTLALPSNNLKIYQSQARLDFKEPNHIINDDDCSKVITLTKNIAIASDEVICLTKPYQFKIDQSLVTEQLPLGQKGQIVHVDALVYSLPLDLYNSHLSVLDFADVKLLSVTVDQFALACNINDEILHNDVVIVDWNLNSTKISIFNNSILYATTNIKIGWNHIVQALMTQMRCGYDKAQKYLQKVININSNYLCDMIVNKYFDEKKKTVVYLTKVDLEHTVQNKINELINCIEYFLTEVGANNKKWEIIFTGITTNLAGFTSYIKNNSKLLNVKYMLNQNPGAYSYHWATLIGITHYQHLLNIFNNNFISAVTQPEVAVPVTKQVDVDYNHDLQQYSPLQTNYQYNDK